MEGNVKENKTWLIKKVDLHCWTEKRGCENDGAVGGRRMTLMASGLGAFSFYKKHELNIAQGRAAGQAMVRQTK